MARMRLVLLQPLGENILHIIVHLNIMMVVKEHREFEMVGTLHGSMFFRFQMKKRSRNFLFLLDESILFVISGF